MRYNSTVHFLKTYGVIILLPRLGAGEGNRVVVHSPAFRESLLFSRCAGHPSFSPHLRRGSIPPSFAKKETRPIRPGFFFWSGRGESNPRHQLGKLMFYH